MDPLLKLVAAVGYIQKRKEEGSSNGGVVINPIDDLFDSICRVVIDQQLRIQNLEKRVENSCKP